MYECNITQHKYKKKFCENDGSNPVRLTALKLKDQKYSSLL